MQRQMRVLQETDDEEHALFVNLFAMRADQHSDFIPPLDPAKRLRQVVILYILKNRS